MRLHRLFGILSTLLSRETITAKELADRFEVSIRTIYRDIEAIEEAGIPLYATPGNSGGIGILPEYKLNKTVISDSEMSYLMTGLSGLRTITDTDKLQVLLSKLSPSNSYLMADSDILIDFSAWNKKAAEALKQKIQLIRMAIMNKNYLQVAYISSKRKSNLKIAPAKVVFKSAGWYLFGKSSEHDEFRFYKINRIDKLSILDEVFVPEQPDVPEDWSDDFTSEKGEEVTIAFDKSMEYQIIDIFGSDNYHIKDREAIIVTFNCANRIWLIHFVLGYGIKAKIIAPESLIDEFHDYVKKILDGIHC